jgi:hypothetical protein
MSNKTTYGERIARVAKLLLVAVALCVATQLSASSLDDKVDIKGKNITVREILNQIEMQTDYTFAFNQSAFDTSRRVDIAATQLEVEDVLKRILADTGFDYTIDGNNMIVIAPKKEQKLATPPKQAETPVEAPAPRPVQNPKPVPAKYTPAPIPVSVAQPMPEPEEVEVVSNLLPDIPQSPRWALKTNLLFDLTTTMNLGFEVRVSPRSTIELTGSYNPWSWKDNRKWKSILVQPEYRWWICDPFAGHFVGLHAQWAHYNFGNLPFGDLKNNRYQGDLYGVGVSYGYSWYLGKRWSLEATVGVGYNYLDYEKFDCLPCGSPLGRQSHNYFGITKLGINLSFLIK